MNIGNFMHVFIWVRLSSTIGIRPELVVEELLFPRVMLRIPKASLFYFSVK